MHRNRCYRVHKNSILVNPMQTPVSVFRTSVACTFIILSFVVFGKGERLFFCSVEGVKALDKRFAAVDCPGKPVYNKAKFGSFY